MELFVDLGLEFLKKIPTSSGVYRYYDVNDNLLYVGKAINLRLRVKSYFQKNNVNSPRITVMVSKIVKIELTITEDETSALLLESNLIKSLKPRYNIVFRDDKSYPYLKVTTHQYPLIEYYRGKSRIGELFGPYPNAYAVRETLDTLQKLFKLRTCSDSEFGSRSRPCLLYQINRCSAPCVDLISASDYKKNIDSAKKFLNGDYADLINELSEKMYVFAENMDFESAANLRDKITFIHRIQSQQIISDSNSPLNADIILVNESVHDKLVIYLIQIRKGLYVGDKHYLLPKLDTVVSLLEGFIEKYYAENSCALIYVDVGLKTEFTNFILERRGVIVSRDLDERVKKILLMGHKNLLQIVENLSVSNIYVSAINRLSVLLNKDSINRIECYDVSHNHGISAVASMVVWSAGQIDKKKYRRYNLPASINGNDLAAFKFILQKRLANTVLDIPDIILVDGGRLQFTIAKNIIDDLGFHDKISIIGIYKGQNRNPVLDRVILNEDIQLEFNSERDIFRLLQVLRDEAHRFAISAHRNKEEIRMTRSRLEDIEGLGAQKRKALIAFFGSSDNVAKASIDELMQVKLIGTALANKIFNFFHG